MSFLFISSIILSWFIFFFIRVNLFVGSNRVRVIKRMLVSAIQSSFPVIFTTLVITVIRRYLFLIIRANVPLFTIPIIFYSYVLFNALLFWIPIIRFGLYHNFKGIVSHMLPYGAPTGLILFLPLVEIFSQIIRPLTLTIRFATNISAGHIIMFIFSYFSMLSSALAPFLYVVLTVLLIIEVFIAFLQSYIFITLIRLYFRETI